MRLDEVRAELDEKARRARFGETALELTRVEFDLLSSLLDNPGRVYTRAQLIDRVWGDGFAISDRTGGWYNKKGIDVKHAIAHVLEHQTLEGFGGGEPISNEQVLELECDVLLPAAMENVTSSFLATSVTAGWSSQLTPSITQAWPITRYRAPLSRRCQPRCFASI